MLRDITLGQYFSADSVIHKADARIKIIITLLLLVLVFCAFNFYSLLFIALVVLILLAATKVPITTYLKNIKIILPILIITMILNLFYIKEGKILFEWWLISLTTGGIERSIFMVVRVVFLILAGSVLTYTTTPNDLTDALERLFSPLKFIGLAGAVHTMAMMMTIALRFIPTLVEETDKIINAQKARGADFESGGLKKKISAVIPILIPLLYSSIRRAYDLAEAMESRCYTGYEGRTRMKIMKLTAIDYVLLLLSAILVLGIIVLNTIF